MQFNAGRIDFINTTPVYAGADKGVVRFPGRVTRGSPAELNSLLRAGELQISSISSVEYAYSWPDLIALPGISISSTGPIRSVLFYSHVPFPEVRGTVGLTKRSATARALVRLIIEDFFSSSVTWKVIDIDREVTIRTGEGAGTSIEAGHGRSCDGPFPHDLDGLLVIGDSALSLNLQEHFPYVVDLGEFWTERTGHPFVFGLWAARRDFALAHPDIVDEYRTCLLRSLGYGLKEMEISVRLAAERSGIAIDEVRAYFERIDYILGAQHIIGLNHFFDLLKARGEIAPDVELRFFSKPSERPRHVG